MAWWLMGEGLRYEVFLLKWHARSFLKGQWRAGIRHHNQTCCPSHEALRPLLYFTYIYKKAQFKIKLKAQKSICKICFLTFSVNLMAEMVSVRAQQTLYLWKGSGTKSASIWCLLHRCVLFVLLVGSVLFGQTNPYAKMIKNIAETGGLDFKT